MLSEVNESTSLASFHGRIVLHIIFELMYDFFPNYNFNNITQRFSKLPPMFLFTDPVPRDNMPKTNIQFLQGNKPLSSAYANSIELTKKFFGLPRIYPLIPTPMPPPTSHLTFDATQTSTHCLGWLVERVFR